MVIPKNLIKKAAAPLLSLSPQIRPLLACIKLADSLFKLCYWHPVLTGSEIIGMLGFGSEYVIYFSDPNPRLIFNSHSYPDPSQALLPTNKYKAVKMNGFKNNLFFSKFRLCAVEIWVEN